eukprot:gene25600-20613_t
MLPAHLHEGNAAAGSGYPISLSPRGSPQIPRRQQSLTDLEGRIGGVAGGSSRTITSAASFVSDFASFRRNMGHAAVVDGMHTGGAQTLPKQKRMQSRMLSDDAGDGIFERVSIRSDGGGAGIPMPSTPDYDGDTSTFGEGASSVAASDDLYDLPPPKRDPPLLAGVPSTSLASASSASPSSTTAAASTPSAAVSRHVTMGGNRYDSHTISFEFPADPPAHFSALQVEKRLLPPPREVQNILDGRMLMLEQFDNNRAAWKRNQFDPVVGWLLEAVADAHLSKKVMLVARRVLAYGGFTRNLCVAGSVNAISGELLTSFDEFITGLQATRTKLGEEMHRIYVTKKLGQALGDAQLDPLLRVHRCFAGKQREAVRQDADGVLDNLGGYFKDGVVDYEDPVAYSERKLMHVLVMACAAVDAIFQGALKKACGRHAVWTRGGPLKKVARMLNKMLADDRDERKPRCMMQIDIIRGMVAVKTPDELKHVLRSLSGSFGGGFAYHKNLFAISDEKAAKRKHLRSVM